MALSICTGMVNEQGMELVEHGTVLFPAAFYHDNLQEEAVPWHWHEELEIFLISEGATEVAVGTDKYILRKGDGIFINSGILHGAWMHGTKGCRYHSVVFHPRLVGGSADSIFFQKYLKPLLKDGSRSFVVLKKEIKWQAEVLELLETAWQSGVREAAGYEFEVRNALSGIISHLFLKSPAQEGELSEKVLRDEERMKRMLQYIQTHYEEELTAAQIAQSASVSVSECLRCFHHTIGIPPIQYVLQHRIQMAAGMLTETEKKIADIGMQCGFQDMSYFARVFRRFRGCTPSEYRKQRQNTSGQEIGSMLQ